MWASDAWNDIEYLRISVENPTTGASVSVDAQVYPYPFFGTIAELGRDVVDLLNFQLGELKEGRGDDSGPINDSGQIIKWYEGSAKLTFRNVSVTNRVSLNRESRETFIHSDFLKQIEKTYQVGELATEDWGSRIVEFVPRRTVFLSHSHSDKRFCRNLADELRRAGISVWIDDAEIRVGESLIEKLRTAIDDVDFVVAVISKASIESEWVKKELDIASNHEIKKKRIKVLPVVRSDLVLPGFLEGKLFADFRKNRNRRKAIEALISAIQNL